MTKTEFIKWRKRMGFTQTEAAKRLGYKYRSTISQFENGYSKITPRVAALCRLLQKTEPR